MNEEIKKVEELNENELDNVNGGHAEDPVGRVCPYCGHLYGLSIIVCPNCNFEAARKNQNN